jgi:polynucleotide 5'-hydroxyl-kinase GRC3/NOL9
MIAVRGSVRKQAPVDRLLGAFVEGQPLCVFLGATDTGKTTLALQLGRRLAEVGRRVALVDSDVGQSHVGPPATVGWAFVPTGELSGRSLAPEGLYFVGATSPAGHFLPTVVGARKMADAAREAGAEVVLVDTTGMVFGSAARALKYWKIDLLSPTDIIALQREGEIEHLLRVWEGRAGLTVHRVPVGPQVRAKPVQERAEHRRLLFREHFAEAREVELELGAVRLAGADLDAPPLPATMLAYAESLLGREIAGAVDAGDHLAFFVSEPPPASAVRSLREAFEGGQDVRVVGLTGYVGRLVGLCGADGCLLSLGVLRKVNPKARRVVVWSAVADPAQVRVCQIGAQRITDLG